jgi:peptide/nickel transport system substrate-binding protein
MKPLHALQAALALAFVLAAACPGRGPQTATPSTGPTPAPAAEAIPPNTLIFARGGDSVDLDPGHPDDGESIKVIESIFEGLVEFKPGTTEVQPALATSWDVSGDGTVYTFHLRPSVEFHDGTPCDADAVLYSLLRQNDDSHPAHGIGGPWRYWGNMSMNEIVKSITKSDASTVVITLTRAEAPFLSNLAMPFCSIVSPTAATKSGERFGHEPVGTGPFRFVQWDQEQRIVLEANDGYWGGRPKLDRVIFEVVKDKNVRALRFQQGEIHVIDDPGPTELQAVKTVRGVNILQAPGMNVGYLAMNETHPPFDNPKVRMAVNLAVDKQRIVDDIFKGTGTVAKNPLPPSLWGYADAVQDFPHDPAKAKQLLAEAGFASGITTTLWYMPVSRPYMPDGKKVAESIQLDLADVGITAKLMTYDWAVYLDKVNAGEHDMALLGWSGDNGDPDNFLFNLLSIQAASQKPTQNIAFYRDKEYDRLVTDAKRLTDQAQRADLYRKAQEVFHADPPWVCLAHNLQVVVTQPSVSGYILYPNARKDFRGVTIATR